MSNHTKYVYSFVTNHKYAETSISDTLAVVSEKHFRSVIANLRLVPKD